MGLGVTRMGTLHGKMLALTGDHNPVHMVAEAAARAGFPQPILHGVTAYGVCAAFAEKSLCSEGGRLREISGRFSAPVFPGETIRLSFWRDGNAARMEAPVPARDTCVFADGRVHAKVAVADRRMCFVTSANLTGYAMERNMEAGLLVTGGGIPAQLNAHLRSLIDAKVVQLA